MISKMIGISSDEGFFRPLCICMGTATTLFAATKALSFLHGCRNPLITSEKKITLENPSKAHPSEKPPTLPLQLSPKRQSSLPLPLARTPTPVDITELRLRPTSRMETLCHKIANPSNTCFINSTLQAWLVFKRPDLLRKESEVTRRMQSAANRITRRGNQSKDKGKKREGIEK